LRLDVAEALVAGRVEAAAEKKTRGDDCGERRLDQRPRRAQRGPARSRHPASLEVCTLLRKPDAIKVDVPLRYVGFDIPNEFVVGYGLDYAERYRDLPFIGTLDPKVYA